MALVVVIGEVASVRGHGRDSVQRRGRADYPNLAGKANQWPVIGGQFRALSSRYSSFNFKLSGPPDKDL